MKNLILIFLLLFSSFTSFGFSDPDTLYVNNYKAVALFFPSPIKQAITGNNHFTFTYNREAPQYLGLLQGIDGEDGNLLVITVDGNVFSYIVKFSDDLKQLTYFIPKKKRVGTEHAIPQKKLSVFEKDSVGRQLEYFERYSEYLLTSSSQHIKTKRRSGIKLKMERLAYSRDQTYLVIEIKNKSGIALELEYLELFRVQGNQKRKSSYQKLSLTPILRYKVPDKVYHSQNFRFVYVFPKFVLGEDEKLQLELQEKKGRRKLILNAKL